MRPRLRRVFWLVLLTAVAWAVLQPRSGHKNGSGALTVTAVAADVLRLGNLTLEPCDIGKSSAGASTLRAYCTSLAVPEDWAHSSGRQIRLKVAVVRAESAQADSDLVVFLDGGPGGAASDDYPGIAGAFAPLLKRHHLLLVDQRGTGGSNALDCGSDQDRGATAASGATGAAELKPLRDCLARLAPRAAPQFYGTLDAVADLEAVRRALGGPQFDLIGISYGTRLAQQYARRHHEAVRTMVLDSAVPNDLALGSEHAANLEAVLRQLSDRCRAARECAEHYVDPYQTLQRVQARLRGHPQQLELRDPYTYDVQQRTITADRLAQLVRLYAYSPHTAAILPYVLKEADQGRYAALLGQTQLVIGEVEESLTGGLALSVSCAEDADRLRLNPDDTSKVLGNELVQELLTLCPLWPHGSRSADFGEPLRGDLPVLVLAGEHDPVTPPRYGAQIVRALARGRLLEAAGQGHVLMPVGCMPRLVSEFIRTADAQRLDTSCLAALGETPFFIDANGSNP